jgi:hypothetical protein
MVVDGFIHGSPPNHWGIEREGSALSSWLREETIQGNPGVFKSRKRSRLKNH